MPAKAPICFVERKPIVGSPAAVAGLRAGDAILTFGSASSISEVAALLQPGKRIELRVMGRDGVVQDQVVVPRAFDPQKPQSLLGCQITDVCPTRFLPHPSLRGLEQHTSLVAIPQEDEVVDVRAEDFPEEPAAAPIAAFNSKAFLYQLPSWHDDAAAPGCEQPVLHDAVSTALTIVEDGPDSPEEQEHRSSPTGERRLQPYSTPAPATKKGDTVVSMPSVRAETAPSQRCPLGTESRWQSRCALMTASLLNLAHGCAFLAAPSFGSEASSVFRAFGHDLWELVTASCDDALDEVALGGISVDDELVLELDDYSERLRQLLSDTSRSTGSTDGQLRFENFVRVAVAVSFLEMLLTASGIALALLPQDASCGIEGLQRFGRDMRCFLAVIYPPAALLLWLMLAAVTMYCLTFRWEADELLRRYWECLDHSLFGAHDEEGRPPPYFESVSVVTSVCASADVSAVLGLFAACSLIGWRTVLRASVVTFGGLSAIGGGLLASLGAVLVGSSGGAMPIAAGLFIGLGGFTFVVGILGVLAAKSERTGLLQLYSMLLAVASLLLVAVSVLLLVGGVESLQHLVDRAASDEIVEEDAEQIISLLQGHRLGLSAASVLCLFLLVMNVSMALGLRWIVRTGDESGGAYAQVTAREIDTPSFTPGDEGEQF
jgi:hypothetical protein